MSRVKNENRTFDGLNNNVSNPTWGSAGTILRRVGAAEYNPDDFSSRDANPRLVSNKVCFQNESPSEQRLTDFTWAWGQFLDHEIDISGEGEEEKNISIPYDVEVPIGVTHNSKETAIIPFHRSASENINGDREQLNGLSAFIDGANVYGPNCTRATALRALDGSGKLKVQCTNKGFMLPFNPGGLDNAHGPNPSNMAPSQFFLAGDVRCNEHAVLTSMHTLFMREHNRVCDEIKNIGGIDTEEDRYQLARKVVAAKMQVITYQEYLPSILGSDFISAEYEGYDSSLDPTIANEFSTAFYRLGHSMLNDEITLGISGGKIMLRDMFFNPQKIIDDGVEEYLGGLHLNLMQNIDSHVVNSVRDFLFNPPGFGQPMNIFLDLVSLNIQRGRDHGLPDYNSCREAYGLPRKAGFHDISSNKVICEALAEVYENNIDGIDPWVGALAEDTVSGAAVGELTKIALTEQFRRLRSGDRFWWENDDSVGLKQMELEIKSTTLGGVLNRNTVDIAFPNDVFHK